MKQSRGKLWKSDRKRMRPLEFWSNERVVYKSAQGGPILVGVFKQHQFIPLATACNDHMEKEETRRKCGPLTDNVVRRKECTQLWSQSSTFRTPSASFVLLAELLADLLFPAHD